jgi:deoxyribodipyrimidine photo-lyase
LEDNTALESASRRAERVVTVFVYDSSILDRLPDRSDRRVTFIHSAVEELSGKLRAIGSALVILTGEPEERIPWLASQVGATTVVSAEDFEPTAVARDEVVRRRLNADGRDLSLVTDHVVHHPRTILSEQSKPLAVFTPYYRKWRKAITQADIADRSADPTVFARREELARMLPISNPSLAELGFGRRELWLEAGASGAGSMLRRFGPSLSNYGIDRDFPAKHGTSGLSAHLRFGTISVRECVRAALRDGSQGGEDWIRELAWRDFYQMLLFWHPEVVDVAFQPALRNLEWPGLAEHFESWKAGQTGYPLVDAAMRCFNAIGWMHNRLRMVVASFLTKDLLVDWRLGERYFADGLLDYELASNNGGWQWSASTGADAQPFFRVFNPVLQSRKFDPTAEFILQWCPELRGLPTEEVHWPQEIDRISRRYPLPLVDHAVQSKRAVELFRAARL